MNHVMVRYTVKADRVEENEALIRQVFEQLDRERSAGVRYASYKLADGQSFAHVVSMDTADGGNPLGGLSAFKAFTADIADRCEVPPAQVALSEVGAYNGLDR